MNWFKRKKSKGLGLFIDLFKEMTFSNGWSVLEKGNERVNWHWNFISFDISEMDIIFTAEPGEWLNDS